MKSTNTNAHKAGGNRFLKSSWQGAKSILDAKGQNRSHWPAVGPGMPRAKWRKRFGAHILNEHPRRPIGSAVNDSEGRRTKAWQMAFCWFVASFKRAGCTPLSELLPQSVCKEWYLPHWVILRFWWHTVYESALKTVKCSTNANFSIYPFSELLKAGNL